MLLLGALPREEAEMPAWLIFFCVVGAVGALALLSHFGWNYWLAPLIERKLGKFFYDAGF